MQFLRLSRCLPWTAAAVFAVSCPAQVMQTPGTMPGAKPLSVPEPTPHQGMPSPSASQPGMPQTASPAGAPGTPGAPGARAANPAPSVPSTPSTPNLPPSLLDKPAEPPHVKLADGALEVEATNSSLSQILKDIETSSGMTVDGFGKDSRVFGFYGPGDPRDVLSELLDGAGYNFLMVGSTDTGTPRAIVLTARSNAPLTPPQANSGAAPEEEEEPLNAPPPVEQITPPPTAAPPADQRPRTPQEMLQQLQQLRQQQSGQPQAQPQSQQPPQ